MRLLSQEDLDALTGVWEIWSKESTSPERITSRARLYFFFLLARFGGLRFNEIHSFSENASLDLQTGLLRLADRHFFLPPVAMRPLRRILSLPNVSSTDFFHLNAGYVRRSFYSIAKIAALAPASCAPRALRYSRALELLHSHVSPQNVANMLGLPSTAPIARLLVENGMVKTAPNHFPMRLLAVKTDLRVGKLHLRHYSGFELEAILPLEELAEIEPITGKTFTASISPGLIFPSDSPLPMANRSPCEITAVIKDDLEARVHLKNRQKLAFMASLDASFAKLENLLPGRETDLYIPAHAIKICGLAE